MTIGKIRRLVVAVGLVLTGLTGVTGCVSEPCVPTDVRVTVAPALSGALFVRDVRIARGQSQQCTLQASVVNNTTGILRFEYKVVWLDAGGMEIPSVVSTWQRWSLAALEVGSLQATAPSADAVDFRFYVKEAR